MTRRELWIPIAVIGLTLAFTLVSWLVRLSGGHPWLIRRKLRLGAVLLGLTWSAAGCNGPGSVTCYLPALEDDVHFDAPFVSSAGLTLDLAAGSELTGEIFGPTSDVYAFQLLAADDTEVRRGDLVATDGAFDESEEAFRIVLDPAGLPATGTLRLYRGAAAVIQPGELMTQLPLTVIAAP